MNLAPPIFPERHVSDPAIRRRAEEVEWLPGKTGTIRALETWVRGGVVHPYGKSVLDALIEREGVDEALAILRERPGRLELRGDLRNMGGMYWSASYWRAGGDPDDHGFCSGYSTPEDAAYSCLFYIEQHEREVYENSLVLGLA